MQKEEEVLLKKLEENLLLKNYSKETVKSYLTQAKNTLPICKTKNPLSKMRKHT